MIFPIFLPIWTWLINLGERVLFGIPVLSVLFNTITHLPISIPVLLFAAIFAGIMNAQLPSGGTCVHPKSFLVFKKQMIRPLRFAPIHAYAHTAVYTFTF